MTPNSIEFIKTVAIALLTSGTIGTLITRWFERHSKVDEIQQTLAAHSEALEMLVKNQMELLNVLHEKGVINGESQKLRETFSDYMYKSQAKGLKQKKNA